MRRLTNKHLPKTTPRLLREQNLNKLTGHGHQGFKSGCQGMRCTYCRAEGIQLLPNPKQCECERALVLMLMYVVGSMRGPMSQQLWIALETVMVPVPGRMLLLQQLLWRLRLRLRLMQMLRLLLMNLHWMLLIKLLLRLLVVRSWMPSARAWTMKVRDSLKFLLRLALIAAASMPELTTGQPMRIAVLFPASVQSLLKGALIQPPISQLQCHTASADGPALKRVTTPRGTSTHAAQRFANRTHGMHGPWP